MILIGHDQQRFAEVQFVQELSEQKGNAFVVTRRLDPSNPTNCLGYVERIQKMKGTKYLISFVFANQNERDLRSALIDRVIFILYFSNY